MRQAGEVKALVALQAGSGRATNAWRARLCSRNEGRAKERGSEWANMGRDGKSSALELSDGRFMHL